MSHPLGIAAGMLLDVTDPVRCVDIAAEAGYDAVGLRFLDGVPDGRQLRAISSRIDDRGLRLLDLEVVQFHADRRADRQNDQLVEMAAVLKPNYVTTVGFHEDRRLLVDQLGTLCDALNPMGVLPALEFLPFSGVRTLVEACDLVSEVGVERAKVLVDVLHLERSGSTASEIAQLPPSLFGMAQFCDAAAVPVDRSNRGLFREAVSDRSLPGEGALDLVGFLRALPAGAPISVEVLSDRLMKESRPEQRAVAALEATRDACRRARWP